MAEKANPKFQRRVEQQILLERLIRQLPTDVITAINLEIVREFPWTVSDDPSSPSLPPSEQ